MTELDEALAAAQKDPAKINAFYTLFLNSDVFIPTQDSRITDTEGRRTREGEEFIPIVVVKKGVPFIPIFDRMERLQAWARGQQVRYLAMQAHALIRSSLDPKLHIALNSGTPYCKEFVPDELAWLRQVVEKIMNPTALTVPAGTKFVVGAPARVPDGLVASLAACMSRNREVQAAYLGQAYFDLPGEKPQLFLVLKLDDTGQDCFPNIREDIGVAIQGLFGQGESLTMMVYDGERVSLSVVEAVKPFYKREDH